MKARSHSSKTISARKNMSTPPAIAVPKIKQPSPVPAPVYATDFELKMENGITQYLNKNGVPANGYYSIRYERDVRTEDMVHSYTIFIKTGHILGGIMQGEWQTRFLVKDEDLDYAENYKDGLLTGLFRVFNPDNTIRYEQDFANGHGTWKSFYASSGKLRLTGDYQHGREEGTWTYYEPNGRIKEYWLYVGGVLKQKAPAH